MSVPAYHFWCSCGVESDVPATDIVGDVKLPDAVSIDCPVCNVEHRIVNPYAIALCYAHGAWDHVPCSPELAETTSFSIDPDEEFGVWHAKEIKRISEVIERESAVFGMDSPVPTPPTARSHP